MFIISPILFAFDLQVFHTLGHYCCIVCIPYGIYDGPFNLPTSFVLSEILAANTLTHLYRVCFIIIIYTYNSFLVVLLRLISFFYVF